MIKFIYSDSTLSTKTFTNINLVEEITFGTDRDKGKFVSFKIKDGFSHTVYEGEKDPLYLYLESLCIE